MLAANMCAQTAGWKVKGSWRSRASTGIATARSRVWGRRRWRKRAPGMRHSTIFCLAGWM